MSRIRAIPGVTNVGAASSFPLTSGGRDGTYIIMSRVDEPLRMEDYPILTKDPKRSGQANFLVVDGNYFETMNIPLLSGRLFNSGDSPNAAHAAIISASLAKSKWPNESPLGKIIQYGNMDGDLRPYTVVGVVGDVRDQNLANEPSPTFYAFQPQRQNAAGELHVVMQTAGDPTSVISSARAIVRQLKPDIPPVLRTMETIVSTSVADRRFVPGAGRRIWGGGARARDARCVQRHLVSSSRSAGRRSAYASRSERSGATSSRSCSVKERCWPSSELSSARSERFS
jgi:hypothetical protein